MLFPPETKRLIASPSERLTFEQLVEIGTDLVHLGVCDGRLDYFGFSAEFQARLLVQLAKLAFTDNKQLQLSLKLIPPFCDKALRRMFLACWHTLNEYCMLLRAANSREWLDMEEDYLVFCYALLKGTYKKANNPEAPSYGSARFCRSFSLALSEVFQGFRECASPTAKKDEGPRSR
jgi:hypothetical protein